MKSSESKCLRGEASFVSPHEVMVNGRSLRAQHFVIATGTRPALPRIEGLDRVGFFTNETIFDELSAKPASLLVFGGGPIGCELAQVFARLGVKVTLAHRGPRLLPREDLDASNLAQRSLEADAIECLFGARFTRVRPDGERLSQCGNAAKSAPRRCSLPPAEFQTRARSTLKPRRSLQ